MTKIPVLIAVTEFQFEEWKKNKIVAKPVIFIDNEQKFAELVEKSIKCLQELFWFNVKWAAQISAAFPFTKVAISKYQM